MAILIEQSRSSQKLIEQSAIDQKLIEQSAIHQKMTDRSESTEKQVRQSRSRSTEKLIELSQSTDQKVCNGHLDQKWWAKNWSSNGDRTDIAIAIEQKTHRAMAIERISRLRSSKTLIVQWRSSGNRDRDRAKHWSSNGDRDGAKNWSRLSKKLNRDRENFDVTDNLGWYKRIICDESPIKSL